MNERGKAGTSKRTTLEALEKATGKTPEALKKARQFPAEYSRSLAVFRHLKSAGDCSWQSMAAMEQVTGCKIGIVEALTCIDIERELKQWPQHQPQASR